MHVESCIEETSGVGAIFFPSKPPTMALILNKELERRRNDLLNCSLTESNSVFPKQIAPIHRQKSAQPIAR